MNWFQIIAIEWMVFTLLIVLYACFNDKFVSFEKAATSLIKRIFVK